MVLVVVRVGIERVRWTARMGDEVTDVLCATGGTVLEERELGAD